MNRPVEITDLAEIRSRILALQVGEGMLLCVKPEGLLQSVRSMIYLDLHAIWPPPKFKTQLTWADDCDVKSVLDIFRVK